MERRSETDRRRGPYKTAREKRPQDQIQIMHMIRRPRKSRDRRADPGSIGGRYKPGSCELPRYLEDRHLSEGFCRDRYSPYHRKAQDT